MYLKIENISKIFEKERGVKNISFQLEKGELVSFLGPSGCGKTTLLNIIGGFVKNDSGSIYLEDKDITEYPPEKREIVTVFQNYALFPHMNVVENVKYGLKYRGYNKEEQIKLAKEYLKIVGLEGYEKNSVGELSGGQQQRVALARALVLQPKILLLDEPFSNLDAKLKIAMREEIKELQKRLGISMIFVTHDQEEALSISDRIVVMSNGEIVQIGKPEEIYYSPKNRYVAEFIGKINFLEIGNKRPEEIKMRRDDSGDAVILNREFMGATTLFVVERLEKKIYVTIPGEEALKYRVGDRVVLELK
ncbi:ABC transporter ATP-binding protein [Fusobacterium mortiferum]|jgi:iron(III) transport system ATP-binding protein|uniref:ABC transporter ATP-binding protein n=1 Tax=Fusobacterium mortiferum ATCC 9817 TaxID=469616 RepID=A0ABM6TYU7_FUSMR|nr:ABC transporter ATP-binding protein [Fusobacterium mortiferum]AVQ19656.1 ABC transporter ATP-binding protein [Fusobacterium mortiferum ATCC 9817]EEO35923.1 ABC transporter, ATP-binding protein [Fusobacterium mortiferum ATCC 9817]MDD7262844.1 ABC transporter ATP-binding protein [Fusobacterium mortiferum]